MELRAYQSAYHNITHAHLLCFGSVCGFVSASMRENLDEIELLKIVWDWRWHFNMMKRAVKNMKSNRVVERRRAWWWRLLGYHTTGSCIRPHFCCSPVPSLHWSTWCLLLYAARLLSLLENNFVTIRQHHKISKFRPDSWRSAETLMQPNLTEEQGVGGKNATCNDVTSSTQTRMLTQEL